MNFTDAKIRSLYKESLAEAVERLASLDVAEGRKPSAQGLNGWVFEQTIRYCLSQELDALGFHPEMKEQEPLVGRARVDLLVGKAAIELKVGGSFGVGDSKYAEYRKAVEQRGWVYLYLTMGEGHAPYRQATESMFGPARAFFLDKEGGWERFVRMVIALVG
jgi:hypothetical protein